MSAKRTDSDDEEDIISHQYKIILLGDGAVGKTSIATRFSEEKFSQNYKQTVGVDFFMKRIDLPRKYRVCSP
jgi:Ras-related protein Rab-28